MKSKQLPFIEKFICLATLSGNSWNSVYKFSEMYLSYCSLSFNSSYFTKMALVEFQHEPVSLDVNEVCFEEEQDIPNRWEKSRKRQSVTEWCSCVK